ncbi:MAG: hypothetical protein ACR2HR_06745 [Euzebya sp.]
MDNVSSLRLIGLEIEDGHGYGLEGQVRLSGCTTLIGLNGVGKTRLIEALKEMTGALAPYGRSRWPTADPGTPYGSVFLQWKRLDSPDPVASWLVEALSDYPEPLLEEAIARGFPEQPFVLDTIVLEKLFQAMSWNEWKSAANSGLRERFWLYLAGNLRADLEHAIPFIRAIKDPFGSLSGDTVEERQIRRAVQLRVREFDTAEHLDLTIVRSDPR